MGKGHANKEPRCTEQEMNRRLLHVANLLSDGLGLREITQDNQVKTWNLSSEQVNVYIKRAWQDIHEFRKEELQTKIDRSVIERDRIKLRCLAIKDYRTALMAMDGRDKIEGILNEREANHFIFSFDVEKLSPEARKRIDEELSVVFGKKKG